MKKIYLPILAVLLVFSSCQCNKNQTPPPPPVASAGVTSGTPTSTMLPPQLTGGVGNFSVLMNPTGTPLACNRVHIFVYFPLSVAGSPQQVTVTSFAPNPTPMTFTDVSGTPSGATYVAPGTFGSPPAVISNTTVNSMPITVSAQIKGGQYQTAILQPLQNGSNDICGFGVVTFSDGVHQAVIVAEDEGVMQ
ncbi:MAG TPA: hypothetical protein VFD13_09765 [Candidatus Kapabacteria bacterium]|nr:hypothetical protein [Candidatus Kapabacteria bacterium]